MNKPMHCKTPAINWVKDRLATRLLLLTFVLSLLPQLLQAQSMVWKAEKQGAIIFLGGTIHLLRPDDYPLPKAFDSAYAKSQVLVFEIDMASMNDPSLAQLMWQQMSYPDARTIQSETSDATYQALVQYAAANSLQLEFYRKAKPGMLWSLFTMLELRKINAVAEGIDSHFSQRAIEDQKPRRHLETIEQQLGFLATLGVGKEDQFYQHMLKEIAAIGAEYKHMVSVWRTGKTEQLNAELIQPMRQNFPDIYQSLLVQRNNRWINEIETYFESPEVEFVMVGTAHLLGNDGLLAQLRARGYQLSAVTAD